MVTTDGLLAQVLREEAGPLVARLSRRYGDFDLAEEAVQSAVVEALSAWRRDGAPDNPAAWLQVAVRPHGPGEVSLEVTNSGAHLEPALAAIAAGKHV
ncbi:MAG TPA: hypothetical protein PK324_16035, partial [Nocardioides sp.]|nr:hypothetical protein [Nocardioides sp.]